MLLKVILVGGIPNIIVFRYGLKIVQLRICIKKMLTLTNLKNHFPTIYVKHQSLRLIDSFLAGQKDFKKIAMKYLLNHLKQKVNISNYNSFETPHDFSWKNQVNKQTNQGLLVTAPFLSPQKKV